MARNVLNLAPPPNTMHRPYLWEAVSDAVWDSGDGAWEVTARRVEQSGALSSTSERVLIGVGGSGDPVPVFAGDRCLQVITASSTRVVVPVAGGANFLHPWKLRWNAADEAIECFTGDVDVYDAGNSITPGAWTDTGLTVADPGFVQVWLMVTYETSQPGTLSASFQYSGGVPIGRAIAFSYYIGSVYRDGAVTFDQSRRSDMDQKLRALTAGSGLAMREANRDRDLYDGSDEAEISLDTASETFTDAVSGVVASTDHNSLANIENIGTQDGAPDVHSHIVPQEWTGTTLQDLIDALVAAGVLYLPEE